MQIAFDDRRRSQARDYGVSRATNSSHAGADLQHFFVGDGLIGKPGRKIGHAGESEHANAHAWRATVTSGTATCPPGPRRSSSGIGSRRGSRRMARAELRTRRFPTRFRAAPPPPAPGAGTAGRRLCPYRRSAARSGHRRGRRPGSCLSMWSRISTRQPGCRSLPTPPAALVRMTARFPCARKRGWGKRRPCMERPSYRCTRPCMTATSCSGRCGRRPGVRRGRWRLSAANGNLAVGENGGNRVGHALGEVTQPGTEHQRDLWAQHGFRANESAAAPARGEFVERDGIR